MRLHRYLLATVLAATILPQAGTAQGTAVSLGVDDHDTAQPVEITSESLALDQSGGTATFEGNVIVGQGELRLTSERMVVEYGPNADNGENEIKVIRLFGGVTFVGPSEAAEARDAVYTLADETIVLTGDVLVTQGPTALSADRLVYNLRTGAGTMSGRVKTVLNPGQ